MNRSRNGKKVICAVCGKEFISAFPHEKYCSLECRDAAKKDRIQAWHRTHPGYSREYMRSYRKGQKRR